MGEDLAARVLDPGLALALIGAYALVANAEFLSGAGLVVPTQIVFVPMLLLLPTPSVPLMVALALLVRSSVDTARGRAARERSIVSVADAWVRPRAGCDPDRWRSPDAGLG